MLRHKTIIVPSALMRAATTAQRFMPMAILMPIMAHQQKKKTGLKGYCVQQAAIPAFAESVL